VASAQAAHGEAQVSLSGSTAAAALSVPCLLLCVYVSGCRRPPETGVSHRQRTDFFIFIL
jgi:hypothetical protein